MVGNFRRALWAGIVVALTMGLAPAAHAGPDERGRELLAVMHEHRPAPSAAASPQHVDAGTDCHHDSTGDATDSRADIVTWCAYHGDDEIRVGMTLMDGTVPATHPSWDGFTAAGWGFDTAGDEAPEYTVLLMRVDGRLAFLMFDGDGNVACRPTEFRADSTAYEAGFAPTCLGEAPQAEVAVLMMFDSAPGSGDPDEIHIDVAPDSGPQTITRHSHDAQPVPTVTPRPAPAPAPGTLRATGRLAGPDRMSTAVAVSRRAFPEGAAVVYLARQDLNPDALVAGALSDGPVLLVPSCGALPAVVADEIRRLGAREVFALGGPGSVCQEILDAAAVA